VANHSLTPVKPLHIDPSLSVPLAWFDGYEQCLDWAEPLADGTCGPNLEYTNEFLELQSESLGQIENQFQVAEDPDWKHVQMLSEGLLYRSRDLRLLVLWLTSQLHLKGLGGLIVFSTQAGRPAIAPDSADKNTFFTESMVKHLNMASADCTFSDLFQMVRHDVRESMLRHPFAVIRKLAQDPFIADNSRVPFTVGNTLNTVDMMNLRLKGEDLYMWKQLRQTRWPPDVLALSDRFLVKYPNSEARVLVELSRRGVILASRALNRRDLKLHRTGFVLPDGVNSDFAQEDLLRASRGDKDAAARVGCLHQESKSIHAQFRHEAWMMYATALGNGIACYELALFYRNQNQPALAAAAESKTVELGFSPPVGLEHFRK
jgi:hypothetical protein